MRMFNWRSWCVAILAFAILSGCAPQPESVVDEGLDDSTIKFERARLVLTEEPDGAQTPTEAKEAATEPTEFVLAGRIDAGIDSGDIDPFQPGRAAFMMSQLPDEGHGADDPNHADNCPFCKRKLKNAPKVIVTFDDESGKLLELDAQELFNVKKGDAVVVTGQGSFDESTGTIQFKANGLFRRNANL